MPVNRYHARVDLIGDYDTGSADGTVTVVDPSRGLAAGGGWFSWPNTGERANVAFVAGYVRGDVPAGRLVFTGHGAVRRRLESTSIDAVAVSAGPDPWAIVEGTGTYAGPGAPADGRVRFVFYAEDRGGSHLDDRVWLQVFDAAGRLIDEVSFDGPPSEMGSELTSGNVTVRIKKLRVPALRDLWVSRRLFVP